MFVNDILIFKILSLELDWTECGIWPLSLRERGQYPMVQLYCLMSPEDSFTDFHIDFGGSSVFYHVLSGKKVFYFIEPTPTNLQKYEEWNKSESQNTHLLSDDVDRCYQLELLPGNTLIIPTGWIHAVQTPNVRLLSIICCNI